MHRRIAIETATSHEARASLTTAIINSAGFGVLMFSEYKPNAWFGGLLALTMAVAFLAEVFILPATIKLLPSVFGADALKRRRTATAAAAVTLIAAAAWPAGAQPRPTGHVSTFVDYMPNRDDTLELRARVFAEQKLEPSQQLRFTLSGYAEGLLARRPDTVEAGIVRVQDANFELRAGRLDVLAGFARVVWGRLDELQPTDVVNPLDVSRFFFEGRSEARLPVALVRGRLFITDDVSFEGIYVPAFRRGRFDQLDEDTSPFNLVAGEALGVCLAIGCPTLPPVIFDDKPDFRGDNAQGGVRVSATTGRVDWSVSAYRGFEPFALYEIVPTMPFSGEPLTLRATYPRFTMFGGDFETVRGAWGVRGEFAAFTEDSFQSSSFLQVVSGSTIEAGAGVDRRAGAYRISGTVLFRREQHDQPLERDSQDRDRRDVSFIASADRSFARERYHLRAFVVVNPIESSAFVRGIGRADLRDNVALETSAGWFAGDGRDVVGRFGDSDFVYMRLKYYF